MTTVGIGSTIQRRDSVLMTEVEGELVMMDVDQEKYFSLNAIGTDIWGRLAEPLVVADLIAALAEDFDASPDVIEADVLELVNSLAENKLLAVLS